MADKWDPIVESSADSVIVGCDSSTSWMLSWWWENYSKHNTTPVVFADFGMRPVDRKWCETHGELISIDGHYRCNWFKKPVAILKCPGKRILWIDTDCEVIGSIRSAFGYAEQTGIAGALDKYTLHGEQATINTGVLAVKHGCPLIEEWATACCNLAGILRGDQEVLAKILNTDFNKINILPSVYNWLRLAGERNAETVIMHWTGRIGKHHIMTQLKGKVEPPPRRQITPMPIVRIPRPRAIHVAPKVIPKQVKKPITMSLISMRKYGVRKPQ